MLNAQVDPAVAETHGDPTATQLRAAAARGELAAQKQLAFLLLMTSTDSDEAIRKSGLAATRSDALKQGVEWLRKAARQGDLDSQFQLGVLHLHNGASGAPQALGVENDFAEAVVWFRLAAEQDNAAAQDNLGDLLLNGEGVERNVTEAYKWYYLAARDNPGLQDKLARTAALLSAAERAKAERRAAKWLRAHRRDD